jgi:hypothetical protein
MEFNTQIFTNIEQSKLLVNLGLSFKTADGAHMGYHITKKKVIYDTIIITSKKTFKVLDGIVNIPAWSLHRLLKLANCFTINNDTVFEDLINIIKNKIENEELDKKYLSNSVPEVRKKYGREELGC